MTLRVWTRLAASFVLLSLAFAGFAQNGPAPGPQGPGLGPAGGPGPGPAGGPGPGGKPVPAPTTNWIDSMLARSLPSLSVASASHGGALYYTPFTFETILDDKFEPTLAAASKLETRKRYIVGASGSYLTIGTGGTAEATSELKTYRDTLTKVFEAVAEASDANLFRFDSELHALYSLDAVGTKLVFQNNWGAAQSPANRGYLTFRYDPATRLFKTESRQVYNLSGFTHAPDRSFANAGWYIRFDAGQFGLVASAAQATAFTLYKAPINVETPADFNPDSIPYQTNPRVSIKDYLRNTTADIEGAQGKVAQNMADKYKAQIAAVGNDPGTKKAAEAVLADIKKTLEAEKSKLRYAPEMYLTFREAALQIRLRSDDIANGTLGMLATPYVYFTNEADSTGVHHPFMVMASYAISDKPVRLLDVPRPPGDGKTDGYASQSVTRDATLQLYLTKIPLRDYGTVSSLAENKMPRTLKSDERDPNPDSVYNMASTSAVGIAVDGIVIYPVLNNTLATAQESAEVSNTGLHVGQGMGLHYHADGHSAQSNDLALYNMNDYPGQSHPPLIGFGFDGIALFGIYESAFPMEGNNVPLDEFGGHSHGVFGYHYHSHSVAAKSMAGNAYTLHVMIKGAWKGKINTIPEFWDTRRGEPAYALSQQSKYVGKK